MSQALRDVQRAMLHAVASRTGVKLLSIKGEVAEAYGLRSVRAKGDIDVWCRPGDLGPFVRALEACGWSRAPRTRASRTLANHASTLLHQDWRYTVDVHSRFPGFMDTPESSFDVAWDTASTVTYAGVPVYIPSLEVSALILMLNGMRAQADQAVAFQEAEALVEVIRDNWDDARKARLLSVARAIGADQSAQPMIGRALGRAPDEGEHVVPMTRELRLWRMEVAAGHSATAQAVRALVVASWRGRLTIARNLLFAPREEFVADHPGAPEGRRLATYRVSRLIRAVRSTPVLCRAYRSSPFRGAPGKHGR